MLMTLVRAAAWSALLTIIVLSVVPGDMRPHVMPDNHYEHFTAYLITGCLYAAGYRRTRSVLLSGLMLTVCAAAMEILQLWIPGRNAAVADFASSTLGAWTGLGSICLVAAIRGRTEVASR